MTAHEVTTVVEPLSLFDDAAIEAARVDKKRTDASIADEIAHRTLRVIGEKWDEDPVFYEKFSTLIRATIDDFRKGRLEEKAYLEKIRSQRHRVETREDDDDPTPAGICGKGNETAFWGISRRELRKAGFDQEDIAENIAVALTGIINRYRTVGWQNDRDVQNRMRNDIDDFFFDEIVGARALQVNAAVIDAIVDDILASARVRMADDGRAR